MTTPPILAEIAGESTVTFRVTLTSGRTIKMEGITDPLTIGVQAFRDAARAGTLASHLFTNRSRTTWAMTFAKPEDIPELMKAWSTATGIGDHGLGRLLDMLDHLDLLEADFQHFYHLDLRAWLDPKGDLTTRRVLALIDGLKYRTESLYWAEVAGIDPLSKAEIILAQQVGTQAGKPHPFLTSRSDREAAEKQRQAMERMASRGLSSE